MMRNQGEKAKRDNGWLADLQVDSEAVGFFLDKQCVDIGRYSRQQIGGKKCLAIS
ncbi:MAG: hypothetical protein ABSE95_03470 [Thermodesulfobacteriota bacterium]|jgi:hypothetical protein